ncbi:MAG: ribosome biogenesis GTPase Der [Actinobacteria bacterium]|nr:ribosome biogenesis GTPase Der [Actinomycetota bacterium]
MSEAVLKSGATGGVVAIVGRPNVGKSSLVNRFVGRRVTIVEERPGVTRDRHVIGAEWNGTSFTVVDTGGWLAGADGVEAAVSAQAAQAIAGADLVLLVVDGSVGLTSEDEQVARLLVRSSLPVLLVANKVDSPALEPEAWSFVKLGLGDPWMVSALHGRGSGDLLDEVVRVLSVVGKSNAPRSSERPEQDSSAEEGPGEPPGDDGAGDTAGNTCPAVAVVGRPNVGKSTLFNRLVGEDRSVVHDMPGTTRDAIDTVVETPHGAVRFVDTAGMRRIARVGKGAEYYAILRALQAVDRADVVLLVIDATEGVTHQDQRLAERVDASGCAMVIVCNKWEMLDAEHRAQVRAQVADRLGFLAYAPVLKISAKTGFRVHKLYPALAEALEAYHRRVPTHRLNTVIKALQAAHPAPGAKILFAVQGAAEPPTFTLFATRLAGTGT